MKKYLYTAFLCYLCLYCHASYAQQTPTATTTSPSSQCAQPNQSSIQCPLSVKMFGEKMWQKMVNAISSATDHIYAYWTHPESHFASDHNSDPLQKSAQSPHHTVFGTPLAHITQPQQAHIKTMSTYDNPYPTGIPLAQAPLGESDVRILSASEPLENEAEDESTQKKSDKSSR